MGSVCAVGSVTPLSVLYGWSYKLDPSYTKGEGKPWGFLADSDMSLDFKGFECQNMSSNSWKVCEHMF